ncbi:MAG: hypothetical protein QG614_525 [Patescibacteria group bacterium]|nr:hypothetical protein [Patescibacteria group bacterium]
MKKEGFKNRKNIIIIATVVFAVIAVIVSWFSFGKYAYWKSQDFKKFTGKVEKCNYVGANMTLYKSVDKDKKIILNGERGEYIPCVLGDNEQGQMCDALLSSLNDCKVVFDSISEEKVYDRSVHQNIINYVLNNQVQDKVFRDELVAKEAENYTGVRYQSEDKTMTITIETEKGYVGGRFTFDNKGVIRTGEWVGTEGNKSIIVLLDDIYTMDQVKLKGKTATYKDVVMTEVK